jgi:predicted enzyme related to lactoylglutathione lyase
MKRATKFYGDVFGWTFTEYQPDYTGFQAPGTLRGGFQLVTENIPKDDANCLVYMYVDDIPAYTKKIKEAGGEIILENKPCGPNGLAAFFRYDLYL